MQGYVCMTAELRAPSKLVTIAGFACKCNETLYKLTLMYVLCLYKISAKNVAF